MHLYRSSSPYRKTAIPVYKIRWPKQPHSPNHCYAWWSQGPPCSTSPLHGIFYRHVPTVYVYAYVYAINIFVDVPISVCTVDMSWIRLVQLHFTNASVIISIVIYMLIHVSNTIQLTIPDSIWRFQSYFTRYSRVDSAFFIQFDSYFPIQFDSHCM